MRPFVYLQVLASGEHLPAPGKRAGKRLLSRVHSYVVDQFVLGLERPAVPRAVLPKTRVIRALRPADVIDREMGDDLVHVGEVFAARFARGRLVGVDPEALHLLLDRLTHVPGKRAWG